MKVIMFGPGYGHNAAGFIDLFKADTNHEYTYISKGKVEWQASKNLKVLSYESKFTIEIISELKKESFIWVHGGYDIKQLLAILYYKNKNSILSINLWGEKVASMSIKNNLRGRVYKYIFNKANILHCNWYGVYDLIKYKYKNAKVHPWGLVDDFFNEDSDGLSEFANNFLKSLPKDKVKFFYPKSILPVSGQLEVIDACNILKDELGSSFVVYLWSGNALDEYMRNECSVRIKKYGLEETVQIIEHPYLPFSDIKEIWGKMDCGLQIAKSDQLSTSFLEPQYLQKEIIATSIAAYVAYNEKFETNLRLVSVDAIEISKAMKEIINGGDIVKPKVLAHRKSIIENEFNFSKNIINFLRDHEAVKRQS